EGVSRYHGSNFGLSHIEVDLSKNRVPSDGRYFSNQFVAPAHILAFRLLPQPFVQKRLLETVPSANFGAWNLAFPHIAIECGQGEAQVFGCLTGRQHIFGTVIRCGSASSRHRTSDQGKKLRAIVGARPREVKPVWRKQYLNLI